MALHKAVREHSIAEVRRLLDAGANVREIKNGREPIDMLWCGTCKNENRARECLDMLVKAGASANTRAGALAQLILQEAPIALIEDMLTTTDCDPSGTGTHNKYSPLQLSLMSSSEKRFKTVNALLKAGADPNNGNSLSCNHHWRGYITSFFPLHEAVCTGDYALVDLLLTHGADPFIHNSLKVSALDWAVHAATSTNPGPESAKILELFEALEAAREAHDARKEALRKELAEYVFHPTRLARLGYFVTSL